MDALFPLKNVFGVDDWRAICSDRGFLHSVFRDTHDKGWSLWSEILLVLEIQKLMLMLWDDQSWKSSSDLITSFAEERDESASRTSFLATAVENSHGHFGPNKMGQHCVEAFKSAQPNNVAPELSKAAIQNPLLYEQPDLQDELLAT